VGYPAASRDPGCVGPACGYLTVTDLEAGPAGFAALERLSPERRRRREELLGVLRRRKDGDPALAGQEEVLAQFQRLAKGDFPRVFDLKREAASVRESYEGEFGQRCLLARRLVEAGTR